jgi:hypothetical protein
MFTCPGTSGSTPLTLTPKNLLPLLVRSAKQFTHRRRLNQVMRGLLPVSLAATFKANTRDGEAVTRHAEVVLPGNRISNSSQFLAVKFDQLAADLAVQMIVLRISVIVFINGSTFEVHLSQQASLHQLFKGAINGCSTNLFQTVFGKILNEIVDIKMVMTPENMIDQRTPGFGNPFAAALKVFLKPLLRGKRYLNFAK